MAEALENDEVKDEIKPYMFEPNPNDSNSNSESTSNDSQDDEHEELERINSWRLKTLEWCKCKCCQIMTKGIESFCCHEKSLEYDEYDNKL